MDTSYNSHPLRAYKRRMLLLLGFLMGIFEKSGWINPMKLAQRMLPTVFGCATSGTLSDGTFLCLQWCMKTIW